MKTIILIRHSESLKDRAIPTEELPLSERGHRRAQKLCSLDLFRPVQAVYTSPYRRAYSTAEKLSERFGVAQLILFIEIDFQLLFQIADQFGGIAPQNFTYGHLYRFAVTDDDDAG